MKKKAYIDFLIHLHKLQNLVLLFSFGNKLKQPSKLRKQLYKFKFYVLLFQKYSWPQYVSPKYLYKNILLFHLPIFKDFFSLYLQQSNHFKLIKFSLKCIIVMSQVLNSDFVF